MKLTDVPSFHLYCNPCFYISTDLARDAREYPVHSRIMSAPIPRLIDPDIGRKGAKAWAAAVRCLLRDINIEGVSVLALTRSTEPRVQVRRPRQSSVHDGRSHPYLSHAESGDWCWRCGLMRASRYRLEVLIGAAYPELVRSEINIRGPRPLVVY